MDIGMSYYVNPNTYGLTTNIKDTAVKDKGAYEKAKTHLLRPVDDVAKSLRTPMKLATHSSLDRNNNSVNIALGSTIKLPGGFKLTVKQYGVEVSGQTNLSNQRESQEASDLAGALSTLLRNADGSRKDVGYSTAQINKWNEDVQKVLQYYGIDTSKDFTVNGMPFSKNDKGIFESQASTEAKMAYDMMSANSGNRSNVVNSDSQSDTTRFDRSIMSANNGALPSFVQKAYSQDEYMAYYEEMIERNKENSEVNLFSKYDDYDGEYHFGKLLGKYTDNKLGYSAEIYETDKGDSVYAAKIKYHNGREVVKQIDVNAVDTSNCGIVDLYTKLKHLEKNGQCDNATMDFVLSHLYMDERVVGANADTNINFKSWFEEQYALEKNNGDSKLDNLLLYL